MLAEFNILVIYGHCIEKRANDKSKFNYKKDELSKKASAIRKEYETFLKNNDPRAYFDVAKHCFSGDKIFTENHVLSRSYFKKAFKLGYNAACYEYLSMCFNALGGRHDFPEVFSYVGEFEKIARSGDELYLLGEIYYFQYLDAGQDNAIDIAEKKLQISRKFFEKAAEQDHAKAKLSLDIITAQGSGEVESTVHDKDPISEIRTACRGLKKSNSHLMIKIAWGASSNKERAKDKLVEFYKKQGSLSLISTICYLHNRYRWDSNQITILREILYIIDSAYTAYTADELYHALSEAEKKDKDFYDENISSDSDPDDEKRQNVTDHMTNKSENVEKIHQQMKWKDYKTVLY